MLVNGILCSLLYFGINISHFLKFLQSSPSSISYDLTTCGINNTNASANYEFSTCENYTASANDTISNDTLKIYSSTTSKQSALQL